MGSGVIRTGARNRVFVLLLIMVGGLAVMPMRTIVSGWHYDGAREVLADPGSGGAEAVPLSEESLARYQQALALLDRAKAMDPLNSTYPRLRAELFSRLAAWMEVNELMGIPQIQGTLSSIEYRRNAVLCMETALSADPAHPGHHFLYAVMKDGEDEQARELEKAAALYPVNSPLRFNIAMVYLQRGNKERALSHAEAVARNDDSYSIRKTDFNPVLIERRAPLYLSLLGNSYLFKSLEIAWRASGHDRELVKRMVPDNDDARAVEQLFYEWKGIEE